MNLQLDRVFQKTLLKELEPYVGMENSVPLRAAIEDKVAMVNNNLWCEHGYNAPLFEVEFIGDNISINIRKRVFGRSY